jgi:GNAT superfamily N-acetyltransferase
MICTEELLGLELGWRAMRPADLDSVMRIAAEVHPAFPEDRAIMEERLLLYPAGCRILSDGNGCFGYLISHPWYHGEAPALNSLLETVPALTDTYYLHDLALLPKVRGSGQAGVVVRAIHHHARAKGYARQALVAVNGSVPFWQRQGFEWVNVPSMEEQLLSYEPEARYMVRLSN